MVRDQEDHHPVITTTGFEHLGHTELACLYMACAAYAFSEEGQRWFGSISESHMRGLPEAEATEGGVNEHPLFHIGRRIHAEAKRRGDAIAAGPLPAGFTWPFASWEIFCDEVARAYTKRSDARARGVRLG